MTSTEIITLHWLNWELGSPEPDSRDLSLFLWLASKSATYRGRREGSRVPVTRPGSVPVPGDKAGTGIHVNGLEMGLSTCCVLSQRLSSSCSTGWREGIVIPEPLWLLQECPGPCRMCLGKTSGEKPNYQPLALFGDSIFA